MHSVSFHRLKLFFKTTRNPESKIIIFPHSPYDVQRQMNEDNNYTTLFSTIFILMGYNDTTKSADDYNAEIIHLLCLNWSTAAEIIFYVPVWFNLCSNITLKTVYCIPRKQKMHFNVFWSIA